MILILTSHGDHSSDQVIDWLNHYGYRHYRINDDDLFSKDKLNINISKDMLGKITHEHADINKATVGWFRKFGLYKDAYFHDTSGKLLDGNLSDYFLCEFTAVTNAIFDSLSQNLNWLCDPGKAISLSKIKQLIYAAKAGLDIPESLITNNHLSARQFIDKHTGIGLIKPVGESEAVGYKRALYFFSPKLLLSSILQSLKQKSFFPSLIQEYLDKDIELRIFYLDRTCYPMAIFSQLDERTKIDFRDYNETKPNRFVPYILPETITDQINVFMESVGLNTGSIDMVKTKSGRYVFLEVNPKGQFGMVSNPCNYYLEEKVALSLIAKS